MTFNIVIEIGIIGAFAAGLGCYVAHPYAKRHGWRYVPRYVTGVTLGHLAFAFVIFSALPVEQASVLYGLLWLITGVEGLATWLAHDNDPDPKPARATLTPEADRLLRDIDEELQK